MRILVCGGRSFKDKAWLEEVLGRFTGPGLVVIHGGAKGADSLAAQWAKGHAEAVEFKADWVAYGTRAGIIRNQRMLDEGKPDLVIAFPGGRGTADMVRRAKKFGVSILDLRDGSCARS